MTEKRTYTFRNGLEVELRKISQFMLSRLMVDNTEKYEVPYKLVQVGRSKEEKLIPFYDEPTYKLLIEEQVGRDRADTIANISVFAVVDEVPESEYEFYKGVALASRGDKTDDAFIKSLWLLNNIEDEEELSDFQQAILGMTTVTKDGVETAQEKFPSSD